MDGERFTSSGAETSPMGGARISGSLSLSSGSGGGGGRGKGRRARDRHSTASSPAATSVCSSPASSAAFWFAFGGASVVALFFLFGLLAHGQLGNEGDYSAQLFIKNKLKTLPEIPVVVKKVEEAIVNSTLQGLEKSRRDIEVLMRKDAGPSLTGVPAPLLRGTVDTSSSAAASGRRRDENETPITLKRSGAQTGPTSESKQKQGASPAISRPVTLPNLASVSKAKPQAAATGGSSKSNVVSVSAVESKAQGRGGKARWGPPKPTSGAPYEPLDCPFSENVAYWHQASPQDDAYRSPFDEPLKRTGRNAGTLLKEKYITFEPDVGGWNNIRMQMELVLVFAAVTGRTLVIPPEQAMYLLDKGKGHENAHSFEDYFPFEKIRTRIRVISMAEFLQREGITGHLTAFNDSSQVLYPPNNKAEVDATKRQEKRAMWAYLRRVSFCPKWEPFKDFLVFPPRLDVNVSTWPNASVYDARRAIFGGERKPVHYGRFLHEVPIIHFISLPEEGYRLLIHFYNFIYFEDPFMDRYYKRFIRDFVHYVDEIFCKGAFIVQDLLQRSGGHYAAFHIRRGELQYKEVKLPAEKILENLGDARLPRSLQVAYVATDERNKTFFDAFRRRFKTVLFLDDYFESAGLGKVNPNFLGMIDQVACTNGDIFVGTWFSTFTAYITRLRGYLGYADTTVFFGDKLRRDRYQSPETPKFPYYMREWNEAWIGIDEA